LVFIPCPVWVKGKRTVLNLNPERPDFCLGSVGRLISKENLGKTFNERKEAIVLVHLIGHGSTADLNTLKDDLLGEGFTVKVYGEHH